VDKGEVLDNPTKIKEIDREGMLEAVSKIPEMLLEAPEISPLPVLPGPKNIVIAGMGGSAISGDIIAEILRDKINVPIYVNREYRVPAFVDKRTLLFAISYSGNTEETLGAVREAEKQKASIVCITSGGKLKEIAEKREYPLALVPTGYQPRAALPFLLMPILKVLEKMKLYTKADNEIKETAKLLERLKKDIGLDNPYRSNPAKQLAAKLVGKIPIIFAVAGSSGTAGLRLKTQFNENSKSTALYNVFSELNHNEIVNLGALKRGEHDFSLLFLRSEGDSDRLVKRMEITKSLIGMQAGGVSEIWAKGKTPLSRTLSLIYFGDFLSVYLAILKEIDPTEVEVINRLKRELKR
jgi:glucose/mannose-6-phosphate isomerase